MPISDALCGIGRLCFDRNFHASKRISIRLLNKANKGANLTEIKFKISNFYFRNVLRKGNDKESNKTKLNN